MGTAGPREAGARGTSRSAAVAEAPEVWSDEGDFVVGIVRRPDPVPCYSCAAGEWDSAGTGKYTEHGIKSLDGFMRSGTGAADALVKLDSELGGPRRPARADERRGEAWEQAERTGNAPSGARSVPW